MKRVYAYIFISIFIFTLFEFSWLNTAPWNSVVYILYNAKNTATGNMFSYCLGIFGSGLILLTITYSILKRFILKNYKKQLLNFHIFCGLLGPCLIVFHTNFQNGGVAGFALVLMLMTVFSGIIGRFIFLDSSTKVHLFETSIYNMKKMENNFPLKITHDISINDFFEVKIIAGEALFYYHRPTFTQVLNNTILGETYYRFKNFELFSQLSQDKVHQIKYYQKTRRKLLYGNGILQLSGYWYLIHIFFSVLFIVFAVTHILITQLFSIGPHL